MLVTGERDVFSDSKMFLRIIRDLRKRSFALLQKVACRTGFRLIPLKEELSFLTGRSVVPSSTAPKEGASQKINP